jgi:hypothetical protein
MTEYITIEGFESMSKQQLFDMALAHVRSTRTKSVRSGTRTCVYGGVGCAASQFIRPEEREGADEIHNHGGCAWRWLVNNCYVPEHEWDFVEMLQECHDRCGSDSGEAFVDEFESDMAVLARTYNLSYTPEQGEV